MILLINCPVNLNIYTTILSSGSPLHVHLTIIASFLLSLILMFSLTSRASFLYSITLCTQVKYQPPFAPFDKI